MDSRKKERPENGARFSKGPLLGVALALAGCAAFLQATAQIGVHCPMPPHATADPGTFEHRWGGFVADAFSRDGEEVWTGEDGGRIRHRDPVTGTWSFQSTPHEVRGFVRRLHFLQNGLVGWAVSSDGWVLYTQDGGASWGVRARIPALPPTAAIDPDQEWEELWDVWFDENGIDGLLVGLRGILYTTDGGVCWQIAELLHGGSPIPLHIYAAVHIELYALDVLVDPPQNLCAGDPTPTGFLGLACSQPGYIFRSLDLGRTWEVVYDTFDLCPLVQGSCLETAACGHLGVAPWIEPWDIEISRHPTAPLAVVVGGTGTSCGLTLTSSDGGCTWVRELHECETPGSGVDCVNDCEYLATPCDPTVPDPAFRHTSYRTLYGTAVDVDNVAYAVGYNAQHLRREVVGGTGVWRDRSTFGPFEEAPERVTIYPMNGVTATDLAGRVWATGIGGHIRRSDDFGETYENEAVGEPFRITAVWFKVDPGTGKHVGWQVGQFFRVAFTEDGGLTWRKGFPDRFFPFGSTLNDVIFASDGLHGVTVGTHIPGDTSSTPPIPNGGPRILWTHNFGDPDWQEPTEIDYVPGSEEFVHVQSALDAVCWAKDTANLHFWTVGQKGLVLRTTDGGDKWTQLTLPEANPHQISLHGVSASSPEAVVVVGSLGHGSDPIEARAYAYLNGTWSSIPVLSTLTGTGTIERLTDVAAFGSVVYAVGQRENDDGRRTGVVMRYEPDPTLGGPAFLEFPGPFAPGEIEGCGIEDASHTNKVLTQVALLPSGTLWIAGLCGYGFQYLPATQQWIDHKTQTSTDFLGIMFVHDDLGYWGGRGGADVNQVIVRYSNQ